MNDFAVCSHAYGITQLTHEIHIARIYNTFLMTKIYFSAEFEFWFYEFQP